jgi:hypothetical protein
MLTNVATLRALTHIAADQDDRYGCISYVHVAQMEDGAVRAQATDGHIALRVTERWDKTVPVADLPAGVDHAGDASAPVLVPIAAIKAITSEKTPRKSPLQNVMNTVAVVPANGRPARVARWSNAWREVALATREDDAVAFPKIEKAIPEPDARPLMVALNVDLLENLCRAARALQADKKQATVRLRFSNDPDKWGKNGYGYEEAVRIEMFTSDGATVDGALMPMRI